MATQGPEHPGRPAPSESLWPHTVTFTGLGTRTWTLLGTSLCRPQSRSPGPQLAMSAAGSQCVVALWLPVVLSRGRVTLRTAPVSPASETSQASPHPHGGPVPAGPRLTLPSSQPCPLPVRTTSGAWACRCTRFSLGTRALGDTPLASGHSGLGGRKGELCFSVLFMSQEPVSEHEPASSGQLRPARCVGSRGPQRTRSSRAGVGLANSETGPPGVGGTPVT